MCRYPCSLGPAFSLVGLLPAHVVAAEQSS
ncbi:hypothetical protein GAR05_03260 [Micromonospora saelicesensis]|uniref:Uncharacterized protein n=1 Tax=Micromonospora saelicesensis TaxID=285676 RepID=A0ABX9CHQ0_9ACTN|nr:hypothetical protein GAR05_03260 [Micromonospora saelicesensis]